MIPVRMNGYSIVIDRGFRIEDVDVITLGMSNKPVPVIMDGIRVGEAVNKGRLVHVKFSEEFSPRRWRRAVFPSKYFVPLVSGEIEGIVAQAVPEEVN